VPEVRFRVRQEATPATAAARRQILAAFVDASGKSFNTIPGTDASFFDMINATVQQDPATSSLGQHVVAGGANFETPPPMITCEGFKPLPETGAKAFRRKRSGRSRSISARPNPPGSLGGIGFRPYPAKAGSPFCASTVRSNHSSPRNGVRARSKWFGRNCLQGGQPRPFRRGCRCRVPDGLGCNILMESSDAMPHSTRRAFASGAALHSERPSSGQPLIIPSTFAANLSRSNGLVITSMPCSMRPLPTAAFSA
jgi:hypothetical protein